MKIKKLNDSNRNNNNNNNNNNKYNLSLLLNEVSTWNLSMYKHFQCM